MTTNEKGTRVMNRLKKAESELKEAKKKLKKTKKELTKCETEVEIREEKVAQALAEYKSLYKDFASKLDNDTYELMREWHDGQTAPKAILRKKQQITVPHKSENPIYSWNNEYEIYCYYQAFSIVQQEPSNFCKNYHTKPSIITASDPNLEIMEKALVNDNVLIKVDDRFESYNIADIIPLIFTFFYRGNRNYDEAINSTKETLEKELIIDNLERLEYNTMQLLFKKFLLANS